MLGYAKVRQAIVVNSYTIFSSAGNDMSKEVGKYYITENMLCASGSPAEARHFDSK